MQPWSLGHSMLRKGLNGAVPELGAESQVSAPSPGTGQGAARMHPLRGSSLPAAGCPSWAGQERVQSSAQGRAGAAHGHRLWHPLRVAAECGWAVGAPSRDLGRGVPPRTTPPPPHTTPCSAERVRPPTLVLGPRSATRHPSGVAGKWPHASGCEPRRCWGSHPPHRAGLPQQGPFLQPLALPWGAGSAWGARRGSSGQQVVGLLLAGPRIAACCLYLAGEPGALHSIIPSWE